jgi:hypothetical protein
MSERCQNCGREGVLKYVEDVVFSTRPTKISHDNGYVEAVEDQQVLQIHRCEGCGAPTVLSYRYIDGWSDPSDYMDLRQVFPVPRSFGDLPDRVAERYRRMLELQYEPDAFAVRAGRVLEAVCSREGVTEGDLGPRLDQLAGKKRETIPRALAAQAHLVREFRNVGGHDDDVEVEAADVPLIREFVESLLEFLYWGPAKLERGRQILQRRVDDAARPDVSA